MKWAVGDRVQKLERIEYFDRLHSMKDQTYFLRTTKVFRNSKHSAWLLYRPEEK